MHLKVWGGPGGSGGSEKHIWKIFYRGDPEIGTPGTPRGSHGTNFFLKNLFSKSYLDGKTDTWLSLRNREYSKVNLNITCLLVVAALVKGF